MCTIIGYKSLKVNKESIHQALLATYTRGPDDERIQEVGCGYLGFQRLSIMGLSPLGMQPFVRDGNYVVCNGEIYGFREIKSELEKSGYTFISQSDCEILLPLYEKYGLDMFKKLDALFMMPRKTILLPPETQSESVHYFMAMIKIIILSLPLKPKT